MTRALALWLVAVASGTCAMAQDCDVCDAEVQMSAAEAECFLEHADGLRSQTDGQQATEVVIAADVLNRMLDLGRPEYVRIA